MNLRSNLTRPLTLALALAAAGALAVAPPARAWNEWNTNTWADGRVVDVQLRVAGQAAPLYLSPQGDMRRYVQAFAGRNYSIVLRNNTGARVGVLISVDGLNVVNGERSALRSNEPMYVLGPWETATIGGWRTSLDDIQKFVFVDEARSYASRTGQANGDMGWIRVLAFREQRVAWQPPAIDWLRSSKPGDRRSEEAPMSRNELERRDGPAAAAPAPTTAQGELAAPERAKSMNSREMSDQSAGGAPSYPGTGWGEHRNDHVEQVEFTAERKATDTLIFRYEYASGLRALGIDVDHDRLRERDRGQLGFAKPPRW